MVCYSSRSDVLKRPFQSFDPTDHRSFYCLKFIETSNKHRSIYFHSNGNSNFQFDFELNNIWKLYAFKWAYIHNMLALEKWDINVFFMSNPTAVSTFLGWVMSALFFLKHALYRAKTKYIQKELKVKLNIQFVMIHCVVSFILSFSK